jgi:hypothetical protein
MRVVHWCLAAVLSAAASWQAASACSVPVFRYALEQWPADPYAAVVFHRGPLTDTQQADLARLQQVNSDGSPAANLIVRTVDLAGASDPVFETLWQEQGTEVLPWLLLKGPPKTGPPPTVWAGEFTTASVNQLLDSPTRRELSRRLLSGESVVWLFLESGRVDEDQPAFELLEKELSRLEGEIELPPISPEDLAGLSVEADALKVAFSVLRLSAADPEEALVVEMLTTVEPDLRDAEIRNQPMAFPVFGRGRALYALVGNGIEPGTIEEASRFLTGACQCTVKAENPGVDLVLAVNWDASLRPVLPYDDEPPTLSGLAGFVAEDAAGPGEETGANRSTEVEVATADSRELAEEAGPPASLPEAASRPADAVGSPEPGERPLSGAVPGTEQAESPETADAAEGGLAPPDASLARNVLLMLGLLAVVVAVVAVLVLPRGR